jgi:hypothetical protein
MDRAWQVVQVVHVHGRCMPACIATRLHAFMLRRLFKPSIHKTKKNQCLVVPLTFI